MAVFPTNGDWCRSPAGYVNEASLFVCFEANFFYFFTCGKQKPTRDMVVLLYVLLMCYTCWSSHVNNMSRLSSAMRDAGMATRSSADKEHRPWSFSAHTRTYEHLSSLTPLRALPSNDLAEQKLPLGGKHVYTVNLKRLVTIQKWPVPDLMKHRCDF